MTPEQALTKKIEIWCGEHNLLCYHLNIGQVLTARNTIFHASNLPTGWPDLMIVCTGGRVAYIETKIHPRKPTPEQLRCQQMLRDRGFISCTCYTLDEFIQAVKPTI